MSNDIETQLRDAIKQSGLTHYRISVDCKIDNHAIARFVDGKQTITMRLAARIAERLGLELQPKGK
jgi:plasmid maintenance system antidote protein VapI